MLNRWVTLLCLGLATLPATATAAEDKISEEARAYFRNGVELLKSQPPNYQDAYYQFKLAYENSRSWKVLGNLGLCAIQLERDGEALEYYEEYLQRGGKNINAEERDAIKRDMLLIRGNTSTLELTASEEAELLDVRVGSRASGQTYPLSSPTTILLRAGTHTLTATDKAGRKLVWEIVLVPGRTTSHHFDFDAPSPEPALPPTSAEPASERVVTSANMEVRGSSFGTLRIVGVVGASLGVLALGSGVVTGIIMKNLESSADERCPKKECASEDDKRQAYADIDQARKLTPIANSLMIGGGALAAVGLGLIVFGGPGQESSESAIRVTPVFTGRTTGLFASGSF